MTINLSLDRAVARVGMLLVGLMCVGLLGYAALTQFIVSTLTDDAVETRRSVLAAAATYFPHSTRLQMRLAAVELAVAAEDEQALPQARAAAAWAVTLAPADAKPRLLLAKALELSGEMDAAEAELRAAIARAPHDTNLRWQLANLLVRETKLDEARGEFRVAVAADHSLLPAALDLLWQVTGNDVGVLTEVAGNQPSARLRLAQFLLAQARLDEAAQVFSQIGRQERLASPETAAFLDKLLALGELALARRLWRDLVAAQSTELVWNGGFETSAPSGLAQFDWNLRRNDYALISTDTSVTRNGARSLKIEFIGRDTTRLTDEVKQLVVLRPGLLYRLECYAKAARLVTPEGPRLAVTRRDSTQPLAVSAPVVPDNPDWQRLAVDFVAPATSAVAITIQRTPRFSYDEPTSGRVWFDDFTLTELGGGALPTR